MNSTQFTSEITELKQRLSDKDQRIKTLEEYIRYMKQQQFGASSEKLSADQMVLFDESEALDLDIDTEDETVDIPTHTRKKKRASIPAHLPRTDIIHDLPENEKVCPKDGTELKHIGDEYSEQLNYIPAKIDVLRHVRRKYACPCCQSYLITASKPPQAIERSIASPILLATIAIQKYCDGLPLYRQAGIFKRLGIELDRGSLANWMIKCGQLIQPLINLLFDHARMQQVLHMDETVLQVLQEKGRSAQQQSRMWVMTTASHSTLSAVLYHYSETRSAAEAAYMLDGFSGALMTDGYGAYDALAKEQQIIQLGCWAHARRYFMDAKKAQPKGKSGKADQALALIQRLYRVEKQMLHATSEERHVAREQTSRLILQQLRQWLDKSLENPIKQGKLAQALTYLNNQWPKLTRYTENGEWPIDNNRAENAVRPFVIGRKNWIFAATPKGASASANLYSLIETAKANGIEPSAYLAEVFTKLPLVKSVEDIEVLLPWNVKEK
tara:strand:+ start:78 stop:1571 length:1494 start_codon:yes stop_codon:yes gene_type:complete